ncbi:TBC1 domain family member 20 isoform X2 [Syngnathus scovelli]|uniref:TBC1 domain family member 20 isoform X2 n=1 Tax=Syngnathus scovelli TaxID=161590 RepID=UPI0021104B48|nr:TBC1 domain family member 20 isoform X2 [Syngnathus scovelli]
MKTSGTASSLINENQNNDRQQRKMADIAQALQASPADVAALRRMAISEGGLLTDEMRCQVWPRLLNVPPNILEQEPETVERDNNKDYNQVLLDVQRSLRRFPPGMPDEQREGLQEELIDIILRVLKRNPQLHYYQGYHDIVVTFLLVVGERLATALVEKLSTHHLRDFMDPTMDNTKHILNYLMPIIERVKPEVHDFMQEAEVGTVFALSWLITWFGHVLADFRHVVRLYDFFLACHPLMPIYFAAVSCTEKRRCWIANVTWPWSITCCHRFLRICPTRPSSAERETCLSSSRHPNWPERLPFATAWRPPRLKTLTWPRRSSGLTRCSTSAGGGNCNSSNSSSRRWQSARRWPGPP